MGDQGVRLRPTEPATLVVAALAAAAVAWLVVSRWYGSMPSLPWFPVLTIGAFAVLEAVVAQNTYVRVHGQGRPTGAVRRTALGRVLGGGGEPVEPLTVARWVVLAKASSLAGAILAGFYGGLLLWLLIEARRLAAAADDLPPAIGGLVASLALIGAALALEWACRVPEPPDDEEPESSD